MGAAHAQHQHSAAPVMLTGHEQERGVQPAPALQAAHSSPAPGPAGPGVAGG
jgi:hypothetical protein